MRAEIRPLISELRIYEDGKADPDSYEIGCLVYHMNKEEIEIRLLDKPIKKDSWIAVVVECQRLAIKRILAVRARFGKKFQHWIDVE